MKIIYDWRNAAGESGKSAYFISFPLLQIQLGLATPDKAIERAKAAAQRDFPKLATANFTICG